MAETGFTPIQLYRTATGSAVPTAGNLADGELAINTNDGKLFFKNSSGAVTEIASTGGSTGTVNSVNVVGGTTGLAPTGGPITSSGNITLAGTLVAANGGTGATSLAANNVILGNNTSAVQVVAPGTSGNLLTSDGTTWASSTPAASGISAGLSIALAMVMGF
jgi:hypothetical protein